MHPQGHHAGKEGERRRHMGEAVLDRPGAEPFDLHARRDATLEPLRQAGGINARGVQEGLFPIARLTTDVAEAIDGADLIMLVVPSSAHAHYAQALAPLIDGRVPIFLNPNAGTQIARLVRYLFRDQLAVFYEKLAQREGPGLFVCGRVLDAARRAAATLSGADRPGPRQARSSAVRLGAMRQLSSASAGQVQHLENTCHRRRHRFSHV